MMPKKNCIYIFTDNPIGDEGITYICDSLMKNSSLTILVLASIHTHTHTQRKNKKRERKNDMKRYHLQRKRSVKNKRIVED